MPGYQFKRIRRLSPEEIERFNAKVDTRAPDGCWPWTGNINDKGYGVFSIDRGRFHAHRVSCFIATGVDPGPLFIRHTCDYKPCVRPSHLTTGTHWDNMKDAVERKRFARGKHNGANTHPEKRTRGEAQPGSVLTEAKVIAARNRYAAGETCLAIAREYGVAPSLVQEIIRGNRWKHVGGPIAQSRPRGRLSQAKYRKRGVLTPAEQYTP